MARMICPRCHGSIAGQRICQCGWRVWIMCIRSVTKRLHEDFGFWGPLKPKVKSLGGFTAAFGARIVQLLAEHHAVVQKKNRRIKKLKARLRAPAVPTVPAKRRTRVWARARRISPVRADADKALAVSAIA